MGSPATTGAPSLLLISGMSRAHARLCWPTWLLSRLCRERALALFAYAAGPWGLGAPSSTLLSCGAASDSSELLPTTPTTAQTSRDAIGQADLQD